MAYGDDIEYLLYKLIDEPKAKEQAEYYKYNGYAENYLSTNTKQLASAAAIQLQKTLESLSVIIPIMELRDADKLVMLDESRVCLFEHATRTSSPASHKLRRMVKASAPTKKLKSLIDNYAHRTGIVGTQTGCIFYVSVPYSEMIRVITTR